MWSQTLPKPRPPARPSFYPGENPEYPCYHYSIYPVHFNYTSRACMCSRWTYTKLLSFVSSYHAYVSFPFRYIHYQNNKKNIVAISLQCTYTHPGYVLLIATILSQEEWRMNSVQFSPTWLKKESLFNTAYVVCRCRDNPLSSMSNKM